MVIFANTLKLTSQKTNINRQLATNKKQEVRHRFFCVARDAHEDITTATLREKGVTAR